MNILISGNPVDGFVYQGPFSSPTEATEAGDEVGADWWIAHLSGPETPPNMLSLAKRHVTDGVRAVIYVELANEEAMRREAMSKQRPDEMPPAATLSSAIDSINQGLPIDGPQVLVSLLVIRDLLPGDTELRSLLDES